MNYVTYREFFMRYGGKRSGAGRKPNLPTTTIRIPVAYKEQIREYASYLAGGGKVKPNKLSGKKVNTMPKKFNELVNKAEPGNKSAIRAVQAWIYLISKANQRQFIKYEELAKLMGYKDNRPLSYILGHIMFYCSQNGLPPLTVIVVNKEGTPGTGLTALQPEEYNVKREDVFNYGWYDLLPPSIKVFQSCYDSSR